MITAHEHAVPNGALAVSPHDSLVTRMGCLLVTVLFLGACTSANSSPEVSNPEGPKRTNDASVEDSSPSWTLEDAHSTVGPAEDATDSEVPPTQVIPVELPGCEEPALENDALDVLETYCGNCHTPEGQAGQTKANDITNIDAHLERQLIIPGQPEASPLYSLIDSGNMPPGDNPAPSADELALLEQWIGCMETPEPVPVNAFVTNEQMYEWIDASLSEWQLIDQRFKRYISLVHLHNAGASEERLHLYRDGVVKLLNSLTWSTTPYAPATVWNSEGLVLEIDLRELEWDTPVLPLPENGEEVLDIWERIEARYPYSVFEENSDVAGWIYTMTEVSKTPVIHADWFAANASTPPLYHEILGIPNTLNELEDIIGIDTQEKVADGVAIRAGLSFSNVSVNNRVVERHGLGLSNDGGVFGNYEGAYWVSYDFAGEKGLQNIIQHPVDFLHDGNEVIFSLPNGFQAYMISTASGQRLDKAPTDIVADPYATAYHIGPEVTNGLSCMSCHYSGIKPAQDVVRDSILNGSQQYPDLVVGSVLNLYPLQEEFDSKQEGDSDRFQQALAAVNIPEASDRDEEPTSQLGYEHLEAMDLADIAASVGLSEDQFQTHPGLNRLKQARAQLANISEKGGLLKRAVFDESFRDITCFLDKGEPVSEGVGVDGLPNHGCAIVRLCNKNSGLDGDVRLTIDGVELEALNGKCSPCRALPVGSNLEASLVVETVSQQLDPVTNTVVTVVEKVIDQAKLLNLSDNTELELSFVPVIQDGQIVDQDLETEILIAGTCGVN